MNRVKNQFGAKTTAARTAGRRTAAVRILVLSTQALNGAVRDRAEAALAKLVGCQRAQELTLAEVGPERVGEIKFGVGELEKKEVRDAKLARGANQQVGIGHAGSGEFARDQLLVDLVGRKRTVCDRTCNRPRRIDDILPSAIGERQCNRHRSVAAGRLD